MHDPQPYGGADRPTTFGAILRDARLSQGRSLQDAERQTRILARHLAALENGDFHLLPPGIYARGFVYNYANWLDLNPQEMVRIFNEARGEPDAAYRPQPVSQHIHTGGPFSPNFVVIVFVIGLLAVGAAWGYSLIVKSPPKRAVLDITVLPATPTALAGTVGAVPANPASRPSTSGAGTITIATAPVGSTTANPAAVTGTTTPPAATGLTVTLKATAKSWVEVYTDGNPTAKFVGFMNPGDTLTFEAKESVRCTIGAPDKVSYTVNGQEKGTFPKEALTKAGFTIKP